MQIILLSQKVIYLLIPHRLSQMKNILNYHILSFQSIPLKKSFELYEWDYLTNNFVTKAKKLSKIIDYSVNITNDTKVAKKSEDYSKYLTKDLIDLVADATFTGQNFDYSSYLTNDLDAGTKNIDEKLNISLISNRILILFLLLKLLFF